MQILLTVVGYILLLVGLLFVYSVVQLITDRSVEKKTSSKYKEGLHSIIGGLLLLTGSIVLSLIYRPLVFLSFLGALIILSGSRFIRQHSKEHDLLHLLKEFRIGFLLFFFGVFLISIAQMSQQQGTPRDSIARRSKAKAQKHEQKKREPQLQVKKSLPKEQKKLVQEKKDIIAVQKSSPQKQNTIIADPVVRKSKNEKIGVIKRMGYVRSGPSRSYRILGVSIANKRVTILKEDDAYYRVSGEYRKGVDGKGGRASGVFWIGSKLVRL